MLVMISRQVLTVNVPNKNTLPKIDTIYVSFQVSFFIFLFIDFGDVFEQKIYSDPL